MVISPVAPVNNAPKNHPCEIAEDITFKINAYFSRGPEITLRLMRDAARCANYSSILTQGIRRYSLDYGAGFLRSLGKLSNICEVPAQAEKFLKNLSVQHLSIAARVSSFARLCFTDEKFARALATLGGGAKFLSKEVCGMSMPLQDGVAKITKFFYKTASLNASIKPIKEKGLSNHYEVCYVTACAIDLGITVGELAGLCFSIEFSAKLLLLNVLADLTCSTLKYYTAQNPYRPGFEAPGRDFPFPHKVYPIERILKTALLITLSRRVELFLAEFSQANGGK